MTYSYVEIDPDMIVARAKANGAPNKPSEPSITPPNKPTKEPKPHKLPPSKPDREPKPERLPPENPPSKPGTEPIKEPQKRIRNNFKNYIYK